MGEIIKLGILSIFAAITILALSIIMDTCVVRADVIKLDEVYINYKSFTGTNRTPYLDVPGLQNHTLQNELNLNVNMDVFDHFYWNNTIHSLNDGQYRVIGWNYKIGLHITDYIDFGWNHFSEHYVDFVSPYGFPLQNSWEINLYIYRPKNAGKGFF